MKPRKKRTPTARELRALASAGLVVTRYSADGRATVQELVAGDSRPPSFFTLNRKHTFVEKEGER